MISKGGSNVITVPYFDSLGVISGSEVCRTAVMEVGQATVVYFIRNSVKQGK
jgi:hypothetical protein